jgi:ankyrin repeat protein
LHHIFHRAMSIPNIIDDILEEDDLDAVEEVDIFQEVKDQCRTSVIRKCIERHPASLGIADQDGNLPLHWLLYNTSSSIDAVLMMIKAYPEALRHQSRYGALPIHMECSRQCRLTVLSTYIELYPSVLTIANHSGCIALHYLLNNRSSSIDAALMVIKAYPAALQKRDADRNLPLHLECYTQFRPSIISTCIEIYPGALDNRAITLICCKVNIKSNFLAYASVLSIVFAARPMSLYNYHRDASGEDIRQDPYYRRKILNLLPRHVFSWTMRHDAESRALNWQPRAAMISLLCQSHKQSRR